MGLHRRRLRSGCRFFCFFVALLLGNPERAFPTALLSDLETWTGVANFLALENDAAGLQIFQEKVLVEKPTEMLLIEKLLDFHLRRKDREALRSFVTRWNQTLKCSRRAARSPFREVCGRVARLWVDNLDSVLFFEESAQKLERSRRLVLDKDCASALGILEELRVKESSARPILQWMSMAYGCLGDMASKSRVDVQLKEMRIFASDS